MQRDSSIIFPMSIVTENICNYSKLNAIYLFFQRKFNTGITLFFKNVIQKIKYLPSLQQQGLICPQSTKQTFPPASFYGASRNFPTAVMQPEKRDYFTAIQAVIFSMLLWGEQERGAFSFSSFGAFCFNSGFYSQGDKCHESEINS